MEAYFEQVTDYLDRALAARGIQVLSVPMRRRDEQGWVIGETFNGVTLRHQLKFQLISPPDTGGVEDAINGFVDALQPLSLTISAMPRRTYEMPCHYVTVRGFIVRLLLMDGTVMRGDVVVG